MYSETYLNAVALCAVRRIGRHHGCSVTLLVKRFYLTSTVFRLKADSFCGRTAKIVIMHKKERGVL